MILAQIVVQTKKLKRKKAIRKTLKRKIRNLAGKKYPALLFYIFYWTQKYYLQCYDFFFSVNSSRSATPTDTKRKLINEALAGPSPKKAKLDLPNYIPGLR